MTTNLPASIAAIIPRILHAKVAATYAAAVDAAVASHVDQAKEEMVRKLVAYVASYELSGPPAPAAPAQDEPTALSKHRAIESGARGFYHDKYVATFRAKFPNGERELCEMIECYPPGGTVSREHIDVIKSHFGMGERSLLLSPMLREFGCHTNMHGDWTTPVLRIEPPTSP